MLSRALYLSAGWFAISLMATLIWGHRLRRGNTLISLGWLLLVTLLVNGWAILTFGVPEEIIFLSAAIFVLGLVCILWRSDWNAFAQVTWATTLLTTLLFIAYAFTVTAFSPLNPLSFLVAIIFFFVEAIALLMALTHTYESLDVSCRIRWQRKTDALVPRPGYNPMVSLHVATHNEPVEVVEKTLRSLAKLDYPNFEVLVVDNNTPDEDTWRPLEGICRQLGPNFHLLHLDEWPGYKAGALNFSLAQTAPHAEIIATIDADYQLEPHFLRELVPAFADPRVAFVQTPQDYIAYEHDTFSEATYYSYKYFFEVSMPVRNEHNAIIFAGTMGLIRKSVLEEIGGWDEWCITEDAETSLRILKRGYQSLYIKRTFGHGLMPFDFEGLKKQRFRWCFGGIQILKKHWEALMPWAHWVDPGNKLTFSQRYFYLVGGLQWFTDLLNLLFALFLVAGAVFSTISTPLQVRPLTGPLLIMPAIFLLLHMWRFVWVLRHKLNLSFNMAMKTMYNFFSLGWAVTLASIQGLVQNEGVFLRTPKSKSRSRIWRAIRVTQWESLIGLSCLSMAILAFISHPNFRTFFLGSLLVWQSSLYLAAPIYSMLSVRHGKKEYRADQGRPIVENRAARWALGLAAVMITVAGVFQLVPAPSVPPQYAQFQPVDVPPERLLGIDRVPIENRTSPPTPTQPMPATQTETSAEIVPAPTASISPTPTPESGATAATPLPTVTPTVIPTMPTPTPGGGNTTTTPQPTSTPSILPTMPPATVTTIAPTDDPPGPTPTATTGTIATPTIPPLLTPTATPLPELSTPTIPSLLTPTATPLPQLSTPTATPIENTPTPIVTP